MVFAVIMTWNEVRYSLLHTGPTSLHYDSLLDHLCHPPAMYKNYWFHTLMRLILQLVHLAYRSVMRLLPLQLCVPSFAFGVTSPLMLGRH